MLNVSGAWRAYAGGVDRTTGQLALLLGAFAGGILLAEVLGAASLGIAFGFGQIAFSLALGFVLLRG